MGHKDTQKSICTIKYMWILTASRPHQLGRQIASDPMQIQMCLKKSQFHSCKWSMTTSWRASWYLFYINIIDSMRKKGVWTGNLFRTLRLREVLTWLWNTMTKLPCFMQIIAVRSAMFENTVGIGLWGTFYFYLYVTERVPDRGV